MERYETITRWRKRAGRVFSASTRYRGLIVTVTCRSRHFVGCLYSFMTSLSQARRMSLEWCGSPPVKKFIREARHGGPTAHVAESGPATGR